MTLRQELRSSLEAHSKRKRAFLEGATSLSFADISKRSVKNALYHVRRNVKPETKILVATSRADRVAEFFLGGLMSGVVPFFIDPRWTKAEVAALVAENLFADLFVDADLDESWKIDFENKTVLRTKKSLFGGLLSGRGESWEEKLAPIEGDWEELPEIDDSKLGLILSTSGSTSAPKLVPLTRANLLSQVRVMYENLDLSSDSKLHSMMNLYHIDGLVTGLLMSALRGVTGVRTPAFKASETAEVIEDVIRYDSTHFLAAPTLFNFLVRFAEPELKRLRSGSALRVAISTAAPLLDETAKRWKELSGLPLANLYGMTEIGNVVFCGPRTETYAEGALGLGMGCDILIDEGELCVAGPTVTPGYLNAETPWLESKGVRHMRTGDLVRLDSSGKLWLEGRKKELIICGGTNIHPNAINEVVAGVEGVHEVATVGVPDEIFGEAAITYVSLEKSCSIDRVWARVEAEITSSKRPREIRVMTELPKNRTGKIDLLALKSHEARDTKHGGSTEDRIRTIAAKVFRRPLAELTMDTSPETCVGWDSLAHMQFVGEIERAFDVTIEPAEVAKIKTLGSARDLVLARTEGPDGDRRESY